MEELPNYGDPALIISGDKSLLSAVSHASLII